MAARDRGTQRVFTFGVGADVQAAMLERIALEGRGTAHFVQPNEDVEHAVGVVAQRLTAPVATNVRLVADGVTLSRIHPSMPQDVFVGQDLVLFARYRGEGPTSLTFEGDSPDGPVRWTQRVTLPSRSRDNAFVAKLWAVQRVGWLSAERRRGGANPELDNELRELGMKFGIPTELSSYLVLEPGMQPPANAPMTRPAGAAGGRGGAGMGTGTGIGVSAAAGPGADFAAARVAAEQRAAKSLADLQANDSGLRRESERNDAAPRQVGERTFLFRNGGWIDTRTRDSVRKVTVKPFGAAYFDLIDKLPELKAIFALGEQVTAGGRGVQLVLDAKGVEQLSASDIASIVRDW
jgi:Ca-activated chloride channel family protein